MNIRPAKPSDQSDLARFDCGSEEPFQAEICEWLSGEAWAWHLEGTNNRLYVLIDDDGTLAGALAYEPGPNSGTWFFRAFGIIRALHDTRHLGTTLFQQCIEDLIAETGIGFAYWRVDPDNLAALKISRKVAEYDGDLGAGNVAFVVQWGTEDL